ncbi:MAG TPA: L,D-transpeptidase [Methylococcaceae bacterium]|jgi:lipoprotein-anchoring transpeptidase ErfK/SrfK|nr:L,D-transpeptidase [Methylococcaceae bacterium]HIN68071.1 L,D-transpeptidase [Methylococcales bacterium]HIA45292.1 L,D-transpeptidase [Methylococcaceae bacterium]HIB63364.1 L,D-transpeptidase [Methylococcaceae bacterium]HIO12917.1 L,D-transpeptidase [Methylococcales bacterium]
MSVADFLDIDLNAQNLSVIRNGEVCRRFVVSTAKNGPGEQAGSECTPRGWHKIKAKIGARAPRHTVFSGRRPTGEIYGASLAKTFPERDWILTRILWLVGLEPGRNRYGSVDSGWRYIYIHGSPDDLVTATPQSHGCVRMKNQDVIALFDLALTGERVLIHE